MWDWLINFNEKIWHPYWPFFDLLITVFILYQLWKVNSNLSSLDKQAKDDANG